MGLIPRVNYFLEILLTLLHEFQSADTSLFFELFYYIRTCVSRYQSINWGLHVIDTCALNQKRTLHF